MDDAAIVALFFQRNEQALQETAGKYGHYCLSIANNILNNAEDAQECVNDTYLAAWNSIPPHRPAFLGTYLGKITRRLSLMKWRKDHAEKRGGGEVSLALEELLDCLPAGKSIDDELEAKALSRIISNFLLTLPADERRVFVCRYWYLDSICSISAQFGFSQSKVKSMLYRTRGKLLSRLKKEGVFIED